MNTKLSLRMSPLAIILMLMSVHVVEGFDPQFRKALRAAFYQLFEDNMPLRRADPPAIRGHVTNCAPNAANFTVEWEPKIVNPEGSVTVYYNYTIPHDFSGGTGDVKLFYNGIPSPVFEDTLQITCNDLKKYLPCPLKGGRTVAGKKSVGNLLVLTGYKGDYKAILQLTNQSGKIMFCALVKVTIK